MGFHPTGRDIIAGATSGGGNTIDAAVHLIAIGAEVVMLLGTLVLTVRLDAQRQLAVSAFIVYAVAIICLIVAAVASGLIAPGVATHVAEAQGSTREMLMAVFTYNGQVNQAFAKLGFARASLAIILWSTAMFRDRFSRALGVYGILMAVIVLAGLGLSRSRFVLHGLGGLVMAGQLAWLIATGLLLRRSALPARSCGRPAPAGPTTGR